MKELTHSERAYWEHYLSTRPENLPLKPFVEAGHAGNRATTDNLLQLYLSGKKTAGSSLLEDFTSAGDPIPQVDRHWILLDSKDSPRCILRTERVVSHRFRNVPLEIAAAEGEGDLSLEYWKRTHAGFFAPYLKDWGVADIEDATVITEFFELVYQGEF